MDFRSSQFDKDFEIFQKEVENSELGIQTFLKELLQPIPTSEARINVLKRFDVLNLDCLCMDRRYLDVAIILEKEIENLKDMYVILGYIKFVIFNLYFLVIMRDVVVVPQLIGE